MTSIFCFVKSQIAFCVLVTMVIKLLLYLAAEVRIWLGNVFPSNPYWWESLPNWANTLTPLKTGISVNLFFHSFFMTKEIHLTTLIMIHMYFKREARVCDFNCPHFSHLVQWKLFSTCRWNVLIEKVDSFAIGLIVYFFCVFELWQELL